MAVTNSPKTARKGGRLLKQLLAPLVGDASPVTVIGLCKNAGKTTAMRRLMAELGEECLGLTSVGRDGECTDLVTGTEKPDLYLKKGDLFATARGMLTLCDATLEVVDLTDVMTPLGPVAVFRTLSDGYVQLAGPSAAGQLPPLTRRFQELGAQRVLIDGAAGRKSLAGAGVEGVALLCTGASLNLKALRGGAMLTGWATVNRLCCIPVLLVLGAWALGFSPQALGILFLISSTPTAAASYVMTRAMGGDSALAANIIATTTLGSLVTTSLGAALMNYLRLMG